MTLNFAIDTSRFDPFKWYSAAVQTMKDYGTTYSKYLDMLNKIAEENGQYILPDTEENKPYRDIINKYNADFEIAASNFNNQMNALNQRLLLNLFRRLRSEIAPINKAIEAYNKDIDKITALGPDVTVANRANRKISDYYGGVNPGIDYRNNKSIQTTAAGVMLGLDNALMRQPLIAGSIASLYFVLKLQGIDGQDALLKILQQRPYLNNEEGIQNASQVLEALNAVYNLYAFKEGTPENSKIWENVVTGAIQGIQAPKYSLLTDHSYLNKLLKEDLRLSKKEFNFKYKKGPNGELLYNPEYLKGLSSRTDTKSEDEMIEKAGNFIPEGDHKETDVATTREVPASNVPIIYKLLYPNAVRWLRAYDANNVAAGYYPVEMTKKIDYSLIPTATAQPDSTKTKEVDITDH